MRYDFSFDAKGLGNALKIGGLIAVILISADAAGQHGADLLATAGAIAGRKNMPAVQTIKPRSPIIQNISVFSSDGTIGVNSMSTTSATYFRKTNLPHNVPVVEGAGAIAIDLETGAILFEKNKDDTYPTASVAKLMTAVIAQETLASSTVITSGPDAISTYGNSGGIVSGESFRTQDLLYGLLLPSSNDASRMFELTQENFVSAMNTKAATLGMTHTHYADSSGLKQETLSSASDLVKLLRYIYITHPEITAASRTREHSIVSGGRKIRHIWDNINWPAGDKKFLGGKAGFTDEAIETMAGIWLISPSKSGTRPIGIVILGTHRRVSDVRTMVSYVENQFIYSTTTLANNIQKPAASFSGATILEAVEEYIK